jgi:hypothetical protein
VTSREDLEVAARRRRRAEAELARRIEAARTAAVDGDERARQAEQRLADREAPDLTQAIALTSIALSLSAMASVLLATLDDEAAR